MGDTELLAETKELALKEKEISGALLRHLGEVDKRKLYAEAGYRSMFHYCLYVLRLSESEAGRRVAAARAARSYTRIHVLLRRGKLNLNTAAMIAPHLTDENHRRMLKLASGKSVRELDAILAGMTGRPEKPDRVRHVGAAAAGSGPAKEGCAQGAGLFPALMGERSPVAPPAKTGRPLTKSGFATDSIDPGPSGAVAGPGNPPGEPAEPDGSAAGNPSSNPFAASGNGSEASRTRGRVQIQFTADEEVLAKLDRAKELLRGRARSGRYEHVLDAVLEAWLDRNDPARVLPRKAAVRARRSGGAATQARESECAGAPARKFGGSAGPAAFGPDGVSDSVNPGPKPRSRRISAEIKAAVYLRDGGRCTYRNAEGRRCEAAENLEFDHIVPFADGGSSDNPRKIRLLCKAHNLSEARRRFGAEFIETAIMRNGAGGRNGKGAARARPPCISSIPEVS